MSQLDRGDAALHYEVYGNGPALLLSNGYSATTRMWEANNCSTCRTLYAHIVGYAWPWPI